MDKISEVFSNIKERVSNPFLFSFMIAWLVYNWRIPVALFWFDEKQISANGCSSIFEFIEDDWKRNGNFSYPFFIAIIYTFGFPIFKNLVSAFQTWINKWGENWNLKISKNSNVSIDKYLSLRNEYTIKIEELEEIISKESETREYNLKLFEEKGDLNAKNYQLQQYINTLENNINQISDTSFLNGQWKFFFIDPLDEFFSDDEMMNSIDIFISNRNWYRIKDAIKTDQEYRIEHFFYDKNNNKLIFIKQKVNTDFDNDNFEDVNFINVLSVNDAAGHYLVGYENGYRVEYRKSP